MNAVEQFNLKFGRRFVEPLEDRTLELMAEFAELKGRREIARRLREQAAQGLQEGPEARTESGAPEEVSDGASETTRGARVLPMTAEEHNAFPNGRWG